MYALPACQALAPEQQHGPPPLLLCVYSTRLLTRPACTPTPVNDAQAKTSIWLFHE